MSDGMTNKDSLARQAMKPARVIVPPSRVRPFLGPLTLSRRDAQEFEGLAEAARQAGDRITELYFRDLARLRRKAAERAA